MTSIDDHGATLAPLGTGNPVQELVHRLDQVHPGSPEQATDLLGGLTDIERAVRDAKARVRKYLGDVAEEEGWQLDGRQVYGDLYVAAQTLGAWERQYDTELLLELLGGDTVSGLLTAHREGLATVTWRWAQLRAYCQRHGIPLGVHRPDDGEWKGAGSPHVVERRKPPTWLADEIPEEEVDR